MERIATATIALTLSLSLLVGPATSANEAAAHAPELIPPVLTTAVRSTIEAPVPEPSTSEPSTSVTGGTPELQGRVSDALDRYEAHGLALPTVEVRIHDDRAGCSGYAGLYSSNGRRHWIDICHVSEWVVLHELAHAWEAVSTSPAIRSAFMLLEQVETWSDEDVHWGQQGTERAANVIAHVVRTGECEDVGASFELLTGMACPSVDA